MVKCPECNGSNYDEWWMCADCYRAISFKQLEAIARAAFFAGVKSGHDYRHEIVFQTADDYLQSEEFKELLRGE